MNTDNAFGVIEQKHNIELRMTSIRFPVQFQGTVDNDAFYFCARHGGWYIAIAPTLNNAVGTNDLNRDELLALGVKFFADGDYDETIDDDALLDTMITIIDASMILYRNGFVLR